MKKIFFLKSSSSHGGEDHEKSAAKRDKKQQPAKMLQRTVGSQSNVENKFRNSEHLPVCERKITETKTISRSSVFRRSRSLSMSSAAKDRGRKSEENATGLRNRQRFPSSHSICDCSDSQFKFTDRDSNPERYNVTTARRPPVEVVCNHASSSNSNPSSPRNSFDSDSVSGQVLDLYMDGDHLQQNLRMADHRPSLPNGIHNRFFAEESKFFIPSNSTSRDSSRSEHRHESPRKLAKDVVERLLMLEQFRDLNPGKICPSWPPMPTNVCDKHLDAKSYPPVNSNSGGGCTLREILDEDTFAINNHSSAFEREYGTVSPEEKVDATDTALRRKLEEVRHRAMELSKELAQERSFQFKTVNVSALSQMIRNLIEEERNLVSEFSDHLQYRIDERAAAKEAVSQLKVEMNIAILKQERENAELQSQLRRELDRRSDDWDSKVGEFLSEEHRLQDRVRELAEHNALLQREVSDLDKKEKDYTEKLSHMGENLKDLVAKLDETKSENDNLQEMLSAIKNNLEAAEEVQSCMDRNLKDKEKENTELIKAASRLRGTCSEQERTIDGLRQCLTSEIDRRQTTGRLQNVTHKLQLEQSRLTEVEQVLRRQLETCTVEIESLRTENIYLLERLKGTGKVSGRSALKLEQELEYCVQCLQNSGISLLSESIHTCEELLRVIARKESRQDTVTQYDMKVQGFKQGLEQLSRSLGKAASVLKEKSEPDNHVPECGTNNQKSNSINRERVEDDLMSELKAESLLTSILKEKMYSKEKEVARFQAELARALQSHDVLKSEIQDAVDTISCLNHKMKNFELQSIEKDGTMNHLKSEARSQEEELGITRRTLSKVTQERDLMWEEVKQYSEKNMLLNRELNSLKKKIDALEEDTLLKDGQISILKDSLSNARPFDALFGADQGELFKL